MLLKEARKQHLLKNNRKDELMMQINRIAFLGLGAMGFPMVNRLCDAGYQVLTAPFTRDPRYDDIKKAEYLSKKGVIIKNSFAEAICGADLIISILPEDKQVLEVYLNSSFINNVKHGAVILEMTSCSPKTVYELIARYKEKGVYILDAPVSGGVSGAQDGKLTIFGSGEKEVFYKLRKPLEVFAENIYWVGEAGSGKALKAINQMLAAVNMVALAESFQIAKKLGIDFEIMFEVIKKSAGNSYVFERKFKNLVNNNFLAGFKLNLMRKDLRIALDSALGLKLPLSRLAYKEYESAKEYDDFDYSAISKLYE
jgi:3-hydroxyisobutyrate dehydrogenase-like beta-hydroxyacid dehydrogenase